MSAQPQRRRHKVGNPELEPRHLDKTGDDGTEARRGNQSKRPRTIAHVPPRSHAVHGNFGIKGAVLGRGMRTVPDSAYHVSRPAREQWRQFGFCNGALCPTVIVTRVPSPRALSTLNTVLAFSCKS